VSEEVTDLRATALALKVKGQGQICIQPEPTRLLSKIASKSDQQF